MRPALLIAAVALGALAPAPAQSSRRAEEPTPYEDATPRAEVRVSREDGVETLHVVALHSTIESILRAVARSTDRDLVGLELLSRNPEVNVDLEGVDLRDGLRWIGGSVGLRIVVGARDIRVREDLAPYPSREQLFSRARDHYFRALVDFPDSEFAPEAMFNRARIEAMTPGRDAEAATGFDQLTERFPKHELVPRALLEAGRSWGRAGDWTEAAARFGALAALPERHGYSITARRLLADAHTRVAAAASNPVVAEENARRALLVLDALDDRDPTEDLAERRARAIIRSRAHSLAGQPVEALKTLDVAERYSDAGARDADLAELRAHAFERSGRYADAVRSWLQYASMTEGSTRRDAYVRAARAANQGGEHLAALAVAKTARNEGFGDAIAPHEAAAWTALDMDPERIDMFGDAEKLARGEKLHADGLHEQAADALRPVFERRSVLDEAQAMRLARAYATSLAELRRIDEAVLVLRRLTERIQTAALRRDVYVLASRLLEDAGEIDRAIRALEGSL